MLYSDDEVLGSNVLVKTKSVLRRILLWSWGKLKLISLLEAQDGIIIIFISVLLNTN